MAAVLITAEIVVGACLIAALAFLVFVFVRRRLLAHGGDLMYCALRRDAAPRWRSGLLRFDDTSLAWLPLLGLTLRPTYCWTRRGLELGSLSPLDPGESYDPTAVRTELVGDPHRGDVARAELALGRDTYTALRAWVEAGPPGRRPVDW